MQIPPSSAVLHALSRSADPATAPRPQTGNADAARAAARAVFAQIKGPAAVAGQGFHVPQATSGAHQPAPAQIPATPPTKPLPRGTLLNILV
jgi:hypothetical protein